MNKRILFFILTLSSVMAFAQNQNSVKLFNTQYHNGNTLPWYAEFKNPQLSETQFWAWFNLNYSDYAKFEFEMETDKTDELDFRHIRYIQKLNGYVVNHSAIIIHLRNNVVESFNTDIFNFTASNNKSEIVNTILQKIVLKHYNTTETYIENLEPEILWAKKTTGYTQDAFYLCNAYRVEVEKGILHEKIYIDKSNGEIILTENLITHIDTINRVKTLYRGLRNITADYVNVDSFRLREKSKRLISTFNQSQNTDFWNRTNFWRDSSYAINDIHWGTEVTMDILKKRFNINSFDNKGTLLYSLSRPGSSGNAFWTLGGNVVNYFTGTNGSVRPCASLDVVGHELGHAVADGVAKLVYSGESGALHESFADIQGYVVERTGDSTKYDWIVGDQVWPSGIRNMANPKAFSNPNTYSGQYWGGGFHSNGGVQNHWFYTLTHGDTATNDNNYSYSIKGLGYEKGVSIIYRAYLNYVTPNTDFSMVATFDVKAARDLYGSCGIEAAMTKEAWKAAGISDTTKIIDFSHGISSQKLYCGVNKQTVPFTSKGDISRKCTWYFSPTDSVVSKSTSKYYATSGTYTIYLKTEVCNKTFRDTSTVSLSLNPIAKIKPTLAQYCITKDTLTIVNQSIKNESSLPIIYSWFAGPFGQLSDKKDFKFTLDYVSDYYVELKAYYPNGCKDTESVVFKVVNNVKPSFTVKNVCPGQAVKLRNTTDISSSTFTFKWEFADTTTKNGFQPVKSFAYSGKKLIVLNCKDIVSGCSDTAHKTVDIFMLPKPIIEMKYFCFGDSVKLYDRSTHSKKITNNLWLLDFGGYRDQDSIIYKVNDTLTKTFMLTVIDESGCENSTSIIAKPEILEANFTTINYCENQTTSYIAKVNNRKPLSSYFWKINNTVKFNGILTPSEKYNPQIINATFYVKTQQCKAEVSKSFEIYESPKASFSVMDEKCSGDTFSFTNNSTYTLPVAHQWSFSNATNSTDKNIKKVWVNANTNSYFVCLREKNNFGCTDSICKIITVNENPICNFNAQNYWINYNGRGYKMLATQANNTQYLWDYGDGNTGNTNEAIHQYANDGVYNVKLKVKNKSGCICEMSKTITVAKSNIQNILVSNIKIYPNPTESIINIKGIENVNYAVSIYSIDGKLVIQNTFNTSTLLNLENISMGIYTIKIFDGSNTYSSKLVVN